VSHSDDPYGGFAVSLGFADATTVLGVRGSLDALSGPELSAIIDVVIDRGHHALIVDLAELDFIDAAGLQVIARGAGRLRRLHGALTLRSPSAMVRRLLAITGMTAHVEIDPAEPAHVHLGPQETIDAGTSPGPSDTRERQFRPARAILSDESAVDGALRLTVALARATVGGADGVSISLRRNGQLATVAASDATISAMDAHQYATGEGPSVDASHEGRWFHVESLDNDERWPAFIPRAQALGINAILSSPLLAAGRPVGALNIYSRTVTAFAPEDQQLAAVIATEASTLLTNAGADPSEVDLTGRVQDALAARQVIAHAQGVLMHREGVDADEAYTMLLRASLAAGIPMRVHALNVVAAARRRHPGSVSGPGSSDDA
jgi:anti-anti-sigma factor